MSDRSSVVKVSAEKIAIHLFDLEVIQGLHGGAPWSDMTKIYQEDKIDDVQIILDAIDELESRT